MSVGEVLKSKRTRIGGSILGGSGIIFLALNLMNDKITKVDESIDKKESAIMQIVESKHVQVLTEINHLQLQVKELKDIAIRMENRIYELNKKGLYSKVEKEESYSN